MTTRIHPILVAEGTLVAYPSGDGRHNVLAVNGAWLDALILNHFSALVEPNVYDGQHDGERIRGVRMTVEIVPGGDSDARDSTEIVTEYLATVPSRKAMLPVEEDEIRWYTGCVARSAHPVNVAALARDCGDTYANADRILRRIAEAFVAERKRGRVLPYDAVSFLAHYRGGRFLS